MRASVSGMAGSWQAREHCRVHQAASEHWAVRSALDAPRRLREASEKGVTDALPPRPSTAPAWFSVMANRVAEVSLEEVAGRRLGVSTHRQSPGWLVSKTTVGGDWVDNGR